MSGRIHLFMLPEHVAKLDELVKVLEVGEDQYSHSHAVQMGLEHVLQLEKDEKLSPEQIAVLKDVPDPVNHGHTTVFLKQFNVNKAFLLIDKYEMSHHDYSLCHLCTWGFIWLLEVIQKGELNEQALHHLKQVQPPKKVMYS